MSPQQTETLAPEVLAQRSAGVEKILHEGTGVAAAVTAAAPTSAPAPAPAIRGRGGRKPGSKNKQSTLAPASIPSTDAKHVTISITLPKNVTEWFEQQASQAPFEPSVQKYLAWQLRQLAASQQKEAEANGAMIAEAQE